MPLREINRRSIPYPPCHHPDTLSICDLEFYCGNCGKMETVLYNENSSSKPPGGWRWLSISDPFFHEYACSIECAKEVAKKLVYATFETSRECI